MTDKREDSQEREQLQAFDYLDLKVRMLRLGVSGVYLAKRLRRSNTAISKALSGERVTLNNRIAKHLDYLEKKELERAQRLTV